MTDKYQEAANAVISELDLRRGFDHFWDPIDEDIKNDILDALAEEIQESIEASDDD